MTTLLATVCHMVLAAQVWTCGPLMPENAAYAAHRATGLSPTHDRNGLLVMDAAALSWWLEFGLSPPFVVRQGDEHWGKAVAAIKTGDNA